MQPGRARTSGLGVPLLPLARWVGRVAPVCPTHGVLVPSCPSAALRVRGVPGLLAPVHRFARVVCCVVSAVSRATWLLFTGAPAPCGVLRVRRPGPLGPRSPVFPLAALCCVCGVLGHLGPVHRCACSVCCFAYAVCWVTWLLFTGVPALSFVFFFAVSWATWLLFTGVPARFVALCLRCPGPLGSWVCRGRGDWWRWRAWGIPRSPVPWGCTGSGGASGCGLAGVRARSPPRAWVGTRGGGGSGACAVCGLTSRVGRGAGTLLAAPGVVLARWGAVHGPGVWALRGGGTRCAALRPRRAPP